MINAADHPMLAFGMPPDVVALSALGVGVSLLFVRAPKRIRHIHLPLLCLAAFALSLGYFYYYLGGAPRIIDATAYLQEARNIAAGSFSFEIPESSASFRGRFLLHTKDDPKRLAVLFPPGYPSLLAVWVKLGAPYLLGPLLGAGIVAVTYLLGLSVTGRRRDALIAATLSAICACLRYHTADTMSHGLSVLLSAGALVATVRAVRGELRVSGHLVLGLILGLLIATRQLTGVVFSIACFASLIWMRPPSRTRVLAWAALGLVPGIALLLWHQQALTGDLLTSAQTRYYDLADGPPGCFGLGLGKGCAYEHSDVVAMQGGHGLTALWAARNTLHRLHFHLLDIANFEPLVLVALPVLWQFRRRRTLRPLLLSLGLVPLGYSLFYFNGSYPGGGARFFAELLPIWHVLIAWGLCRLRQAKLGVALALVGFAVHGSFSHQLLRDPTFGPDGRHLTQIPALLDQAGARVVGDRQPLVFFRTAHEFNLAHMSDPGFRAARSTHDGRQSYLASRAPSAFEYQLTEGAPTLTPIEDRARAKESPVTLEAEFDYPPLAKSNLWVHPEYVAAACASRGRALALHPTSDEPHLELEVVAAPSAAATVTLIGIVGGTRCVTIPVDWKAQGTTVELGPATLRNLSHIDRLILTPTHF